MTEELFAGFTGRRVATERGTVFARVGGAARVARRGGHEACRRAVARRVVSGIDLVLGRGGHAKYLQVEPGLAGGRAPARAFHDYMLRAVASRPAEPFATEVQTPDWQMEPDNGIWFAPADGEGDGGLFVDPDGNPVERALPPEDEDEPREDAKPREDEDVRIERTDRPPRERPIARPVRPPSRPDDNRPPVRRGDTFPGLGPQWLRIAVRDRATDDALLEALDDLRR